MFVRGLAEAAAAIPMEPLYSDEEAPMSEPFLQSRGRRTQGAVLPPCRPPGRTRPQPHHARRGRAPGRAQGDAGAGGARRRRLRRGDEGRAHRPGLGRRVRQRRRPGAGDRRTAQGSRRRGRQRRASGHRDDTQAWLSAAGPGCLRTAGHRTRASVCRRSASRSIRRAAAQCRARTLARVRRSLRRRHPRLRLAARPRRWPRRRRRRQCALPAVHDAGRQRIRSAGVSRRYARGLRLDAETRRAARPVPEASRRRRHAAPARTTRPRSTRSPGRPTARRSRT